jgi:hypothetical protein
LQAKLAQYDPQWKSRSPHDDQRRTHHQQRHHKSLRWWQHRRLSRDEWQYSSGSTIEGNYATAASAQTAGQIIFQPGSVIKPGSAGGETALPANGVGAGGQPSQITATSLTVNMNGFGGDRGAIASGGGSIFLNQGTTISFPPGGGGDIGLLATGANSQIVANGITETMVGVGGGDVGVNADMGGKVTLTNSIVSDVGNGGGEVGLKATN